jgi:hypothetical protein
MVMGLFLVAFIITDLPDFVLCNMLTGYLAFSHDGETLTIELQKHHICHKSFVVDST